MKHSLFPLFSRRDFLRAGPKLIGAAAGAGATAWASSAIGRQKLDQKTDGPRDGWIDAHSHVWSPDLARWPLKGGQTVKDLKPRSFTPEELLAIARPEGVERAVLIQHHLYHGFDNSYLIDCARRFPGKFAVVGMIDDRTERPDALLRELGKHGVQALRITSWIHPRSWLEGDGMARLWRAAAKTGQAMCLLINPVDLTAADAMCAKHPDTKVVIDHFARIGVDGKIRESQVRQLGRMARHKNVYVKISAYYALGKKKPPYSDLVPMIRQMLSAYGPQRLMWASDCPYQLGPGHTYRDSIGLIRDRLDFLSAEDRLWLLRKTAEKVYFAKLNL